MDRKPLSMITEGAYNRITEFEWLYNAHLEARKQKRYRTDVLLFSDNLEANLFQLRDELRSGEYRIGPYRKFFVFEPTQRLIMALQYRDRVVQWAVYSLLYPFFDRMMIEDSFACRRGKGTHRAADRLQYWLRQVHRKAGKWYYLKTDVSKYFYRIDHRILLEIFERRVKDRALLSLLRLIINSEDTRFGLPAGFAPWACPEDMWLYDVGVPIGNLTSQLFANVYLNELDQFIKHGLKVHHYIRYMDDGILLSDSKSQLHDWEGAIEEFLVAHLHLDLNNKTVVRPVDEGVPFVGYRLSGTHRILRKQTSRRIIRNTKSLCRSLAEGAITREQFDRVIASYNGILQYCESGGLRSHLNDIYCDLVLQLPHPRLQERLLFHEQDGGIRCTLTPALS